MTDQSVRVIVVDDDSDAVDALAMLLELDGYQVCKAYNGLQALDKITEFAPHCVLFDVDMPSIDGFEMSKRIRERHGDDIVLIAVTGREVRDTRVSGAFVVADHYLLKPVDAAAIRKLLRPVNAAPSKR